MDRRKASIVPPKSIEEARERLVDVAARITAIKSMMEVSGSRIREDGLPMTPDEYRSWKKRATGALHWFIKEQEIIQQWIKLYEKDVRAEEHAERQRQAAKNKEERNERHQRLMRYQELMRADEPIDIHDPWNMLRHTQRLLKKLAKDKRVSYSSDEESLLDLIDQCMRDRGV